MTQRLDILSRDTLLDTKPTKNDKSTGKHKNNIHSTNSLQKSFLQLPDSFNKLTTSVQSLAISFARGTIDEEYRITSSNAKNGQDRSEASLSNKNSEQTDNSLIDRSKAPPVWVTYKNFIFLFLFPILLLNVFFFMDKRPVLCPVPCYTLEVRPIYPYLPDSTGGTSSGKTTIKACEKAWAYHKNFCQPRCIPCKKSDDLCIYNWMDPKTKKNNGTESQPQLYWQKQKDAGCVDETELLKIGNHNYDLLLDGMLYAFEETKEMFDEIFNYKKAATAYCVLVMTIFWIQETVPLPVTALMPIFLYPMFSIVASKDLVICYFSNIIALFFGGLAVAAAIEHTCLHRRMALKVLTIFGGEPKFLLLGFMSITAFLAMWISNIATAAMIFPTAIAVMEELKSNLDAEVEREGKERAKSKEQKERLERSEKSETHKRHDNEEDGMALSRFDVSLAIIGESDTEYKTQIQAKYHAQDMLMRAMCIGICYSSSIGGLGMFTGTPTNMIFAGLLSDDCGVTFGTFAVFNTPISIVLTLIGWGVLYFVFIRGTKELTQEELTRIKNMIRNRYEALGQASYQEKAVGTVFGILVSLWLTRNPGFMPGWGHFYPFNLKNSNGTRYVTDATVAVLMAFILFIIPKHPIWRFRKPEPLISFKHCCKMIPWGVLFLLGGGFAMAEGIKRSGLGSWIGIQLYFLEGVESWVLVLSIIVLCSVTTQFMSNTGK